MGKRNSGAGNGKKKTAGKDGCDGLIEKTFELFIQAKKKNMDVVESYFAQVISAANSSGYAKVDWACLPNNGFEDLIRTMNQLYLYAKVCHQRPADYQEVIDTLRKKHPILAKRITGAL